MIVLEGDGIGSMYYKLIRMVTDNGRKITVRGHKVIELQEPVSLVYKKPGYCWMDIPGRRANPFFLLAEVYWILTGRGDIDWISYYNKQMREYNDGREDNHGAYGLRIRRWKTRLGEQQGIQEIDQIAQVVKKLQDDPFSRQAVISLWDPERDNLVRSKDYPCNNLVYYSLRDGYLNQTVIIRSNDLVWGTPTNAVQYSHLHALVAGNLGVKMGTFTYVIQNLHYYFDQYKETLALLLEHAYDAHPLSDEEEGFLSGPGALCIPNFDTVTDNDLKVLKGNISYIYDFWRTKNQTFRNWAELRQAHFTGEGYWNQTLPLVIWIHRILKEGILSQEDKEYLAVRILTLGSPLVGLILDFLKGSSLSLNKEIAAICKLLLERPLANA